MHFLQLSFSQYERLRKQSIDLNLHSLMIHNSIIIIFALRITQWYPFTDYFIHVVSWESQPIIIITTDNRDAICYFLCCCCNCWGGFTTIDEENDNELLQFHEDDANFDDGYYWKPSNFTNKKNKTLKLETIHSTFSNIRWIVSIWCVLKKIS